MLKIKDLHVSYGGIRALRGGGRTRTALFGVYPDSRPDRIKQIGFLAEMSRLGVKAPEADVFTAPAISMSAGRSEMSLILSMFTAELYISNRIRSALN